MELGLAEELPIPRRLLATDLDRHPDRAQEDRLRQRDVVAVDQPLGRDIVEAQQAVLIAQIGEERGHQGFGIHVQIGGDVYAGSTQGAATGVEAKTYDVNGDVYVGVGGNVAAKAFGGNAYGVDVYSAGTANVSVGGFAYAYSKTDNATAISVIAYGDANISVGGDVRAVAYDRATGVYDESSGGVTGVSIGGNVTAISTGASRRWSVRSPKRKQRRTRPRKAMHRRLKSFELRLARIAGFLRDRAAEVEEAQAIRRGREGIAPTPPRRPASATRWRPCPAPRRSLPD